jgi:hypothetical protein
MPYRQADYREAFLPPAKTIADNGTAASFLRRALLARRRARGNGGTV